MKARYGKKLYQIQNAPLEEKCRFASSGAYDDSTGSVTRNLCDIFQVENLAQALEKIAKEVTILKNQNSS